MSCRSRGTGSHRGFGEPQRSGCSSSALGGDGHLSRTSLPRRFTISCRGADFWPGQPGSRAGGSLWQSGFQGLVKARVVNKTGARVWKGRVWIQSCSAVLDKQKLGTVTKTLSIFFVVVSILKESYYRSAKIVESLRLAKTSKIIKSNRHSITTTPAKPCPQVSHPHGV